MTNPADSSVFCKFGAPMGRDSCDLVGGKLPEHKVRLQRVQLDSGGYDKGGAYWGIGEPLWVAFDDRGGEVYHRATDRGHAKRKLQHQYSNQLRFYR